MKRSLALFALAILLAASPAAAQFKQVANRIASESGMSREYVPGFGLARLAVRVIHPDGVRDLKLAIFNSASATRDFDADSILGASLDKAWQPLVRFADRRSGEQGAIYAKPAGDGEVSLMIFSTDADDSVLVEMRIDPARLAEIVDDGAHGSFSVE